MEVASFPAFDSNYPVFDRLHNASDQKLDSGKAASDQKLDSGKAASDQKLDSGKAASDQKLDGGKAWERGYMEAEEW